MKAYLQWVVGQRKWVILASMLLTVFFALQLKNLTVLIDPDKSVPQTHPLIVATNRIEALFGNKFTAVIVVTPTQGDAFQPEILRKIQRITAKIAREPTLVRSSLPSLSARKVKSISGSEAGLEVKPLMEKVPTTPAEMAALRATLQSNPAYEKSVVQLLVELRILRHVGGERAVRPFLLAFARRRPASRRRGRGVAGGVRRRRAVFFSPSPSRWPRSSASLIASTSCRSFGTSGRISMSGSMPLAWIERPDGV